MQHNCFLCSWATSVLLQPGSFTGAVRQDKDDSLPFLGKALLSHLWCDFSELYPFQMWRSCCYWSMRRKYFQCCLNMLFRSIGRKMATWIRGGVGGGGGRSLSSALPPPASTGFFSAGAEGHLEIPFVVSCTLHTSVTMSKWTGNEREDLRQKPCRYLSASVCLFPDGLANLSQR